MIRRANPCGVMVSCAVVVMMMMMMMSEVTAMPKMRVKRGSSKDVHMVSLHLDPAITFTPAQSVRSLHNASISPWTYNLSIDNNRIPRVLPEARCLLKGCLDVNGREDQSLRSQPIMQQGLLLHRISAPGGGKRYHYRLESRAFAVGCVCVRQVVVTQH